MTKSNDNGITSKSGNSEIRSFFIDTTIDIVNIMTNKAMNGRIRDGENEKIKIQQYKTIINACNVGNRILKDKQLDEYEQDIIALKNGLLGKEDASSNDEVLENIMELDKLDEEIQKLKEE